MYCLFEQTKIDEKEAGVDPLKSYIYVKYSLKIQNVDQLEKIDKSLGSRNMKRKRAFRFGLFATLIKTILTFQFV